ncbi:hypothetical protein BBP40_006898 [Aspergillus hancockii]|nr:hypothetical protein BBP40_006898 [Aspergillus hancockii]
MVGIHASANTIIALESRDVATTLNYIIPPGHEGLNPIDSGIPEPARRMTQRDGITDVREVLIKDVRGRVEDFTLDVQGFQYVKHSVQGVTDWRDPRQVKEIAQPATEELVKQLTGASRVVVYITRNRYDGNEKGNKMSTPNSPSHGVHTDLTHASCPGTLKEVLPGHEIKRLLRHRYVVINVWRPIKTIRRDPLAVCDWRSVNPAKDIVNDRRVVSGSILEFGVPTYRESHDWFYLSEQQPDEPLVFKQLDSNPEANITLLHSAFVDPKYADYPPRESIEMKCFAFFNE